MYARLFGYEKAFFCAIFPRAVFPPAQGALPIVQIISRGIPKVNLKLYGFLGALSLCLLCGNGNAQETAKTAGPKPASTQRTVAPPPLDPLAQVAAKAGVKACLGRINQVSSFLTGGNQSGVYLFSASSLSDKNLFSSSYEIVAKPGVSTYASMTAAPLPAGGCSALYEGVAYWNNSCEEVAAKAFAGAKTVGLLRQAITMLDGGPTLKIFLMPAGSGCVSIKKEVLR